MSRRSQLALLATTLALAAPVGAQAKHSPTSTCRTPWPRAPAAPPRPSTAWPPAPRWRCCKRNGNAVDAAVAAAAVLGVTEPFSSGIGGGGFMVIRTQKGKVTTIDGREEAPASMTPTAFIDPATGTPLPFAEGRYSGLSAGVPGTVATWDTALKRYGSWSLKRALQRGIDVAERGFVIDRTFYEQANDNLAYFDDISLLGRALPRPGRHDPRHRHRPAQPGHGAHVRAHRQARSGGLLPRPGRGGDGRRRAEAAARPPAPTSARLAARPAHDGRPGAVRGDRARADARALPRARRLRHGAAVVGRLDRRRGAQHHRGRSRLRFADADPAVPLVPRGLALRLRRPRPVRRRPGVRRRPAAWPAVAVLRGRAADADRSGHRLHQPCGVRGSDGQRRRDAHPRGVRRRRGRPAAALDDAPHRRRRRGHRRDLHVHDRVDRAATASSCRAGASSSTTS